MTEDEKNRVIQAVKSAAKRTGWLETWRCPKCHLDLIKISRRVDGKDEWVAADYCKECGWLAGGAIGPDRPVSDAVRTVDSIPVVPHVTSDPLKLRFGSREKYMSMSIESQMAAQSAYLADVLEWSVTYGRLSREARKRLRQIQLDLTRWAMAYQDLRNDLEDMKVAEAEMESSWWRQMFKEWWNR